MTPKKVTFPATRPATRGTSPAFVRAREAIMWRMALMSLGILGIALSACDQGVQIATPGAGDYEVVALVAD